VDEKPSDVGNQALERRWLEIRDREIAAGSSLGLRVIEEPGFEEKWHRAILWVLEHPPATGKPSNRQADAARTEARRVPAAEPKRKADTEAARKVARGREAIARKTLADETRQAKDRQDTILSDIASHAPRLRTTSSRPARDADGTSPALVCPHGMDRSLCAYCGRRRR
jgi:hypothetical protein